MVRKHIFALAVLPGMMFPALSQAAALQASPTTVQFKQDGKGRQVWLSGTGSEPVSGQVRVYRWTQQDGRDVLTEARDLVASPPVMQIPAGETQVVRLINKTQAAGQEQAYRLIVNELPAGKAADKPGVRFLLKYSIPVFVAPKTASVKGGVNFTLHQDHEQQWLVADSTRNTHVRLSKLEFVSAAGKVQPLRPGLLGYVLAESHRQWAVKVPPQKGTLRAIINEGTSPETLLSVPG